MAISRAQQLKQLLPGLNSLFGLEYKTYREEHRDLYDAESSDRSFEEDVKLYGFGAAPIKKEGVGITYDNAGELWTARYTHETVAMGFAITEEALEDNLYVSIAGRYTKALARGMAYTKQVKSAFPFNNGFSGGSYTSGDGVTLFNTAHPQATGGTLSNTQSTPADFNETSLEAATIQIAKWTDERGLLMASRPVKLVIPVDYSFVATRVLQSELRVGTADNDINALRAMGTVQGAVVNHFLTSTTKWFLKTDIPNGAKHFTRVGMKTGMEGDFDTGNVRYKARERYSFGFSDYLSYFGGGT